MTEYNIKWNEINSSFFVSYCVSPFRHFPMQTTDENSRKKLIQPTFFPWIGLNDFWYEYFFLTLVNVDTRSLGSVQKIRHMWHIYVFVRSTPFPYNFCDNVTGLSSFYIEHLSMWHLYVLFRPISIWIMYMYMYMYDNTPTMWHLVTLRHFIPFYIDTCGIWRPSSFLLAWWICYFFETKTADISMYFFYKCYLAVFCRCGHPWAS